MSNKTLDEQLIDQQEQDHHTAVLSDEEIDRLDRELNGEQYKETNDEGTH